MFLWVKIRGIPIPWPAQPVEDGENVTVYTKWVSNGISVIMFTCYCVCCETRFWFVKVK